MSALTAFPTLRPVEERQDAESLEQLVVVFLEDLAHLALVDGHRRKAARLLDAAGLLRNAAESRQPAALTPREWDVAKLVAQGHSNRDIAYQLVVSERTVDTHVSHILRKMALKSRAQIAAWVVEQHHSLRVLRA